MDQECIQLLQWALPKIDMQWSGFRKVRKQVCKRIKRRMKHLELENWNDYKQYIKYNQLEWQVLDRFCRITISRFYRDKYLFNYLGDVVIPRLILNFPEVETLSCISLGCASGEEPYTIALIWREKIRRIDLPKSIRIVGIDVDPIMLQRAGEAIYSSSTIRELPDAWKKEAFIVEEGLYKLKDDYKQMVEFIQTDIRDFEPKYPQHLVCCRNLVATYYSKKLQIEIFQKIRSVMPEGSTLILGAHEALPAEVNGFEQDKELRHVYWTIEKL